MMPLDGWPHSVPDNVLSFSHAVKTRSWQFWFPTRHYDTPKERSFNKYNGGTTSHSDIGNSKKFNNNGAYDWIKSEAIAGDVSF
jgi:hypothetical protein